MRFDWTLNFGHVLTAGAMLTAIFLSYGNLNKQLALIELRLSVAERGLTTMADQSTRIAVLERVVNELPDKLDEMSSTLRTIEGSLP